MPEVDLDVSRETIEKLSAFAALVDKWTSKINLISKQDRSDIWQRHIIDSAQLYSLGLGQGNWVDLGSGGGFPAIVLAILDQDRENRFRFTLVESDIRKAVFLRTAIRELGLSAEVVSDRIEKIPSLHASVLSARALADLDTLLGFAERHLDEQGVALFPKGEQWEKEDETARQRWSYDCVPTKSITNPSAAVLMIKDIARV